MHVAHEEQPAGLTLRPLKGGRKSTVVAGHRGARAMSWGAQEIFRPGKLLCVEVQWRMPVPCVGQTHGTYAAKREARSPRWAFTAEEVPVLACPSGSCATPARPWLRGGTARREGGQGPRGGFAPCFRDPKPPSH